jgi:hypothetical protein
MHALGRILNPWAASFDARKVAAELLGFERANVIFACVGSASFSS